VELVLAQVVAVDLQVAVDQVDQVVLQVLLVAVVLQVLQALVIFIHKVLHQIHGQ
jgi:hypothetical protein